MNKNRSIYVAWLDSILDYIINMFGINESMTFFNDPTSFKINSNILTLLSKGEGANGLTSSQLTSSIHPNGKTVKRVLLWGYPDIKYGYKIIYFAIGDLNEWKIKANVMKISMLSGIGTKTARKAIMKLRNRGLVRGRLINRTWEYFIKTPNFHDPSFKNMMIKIDDD